MQIICISNTKWQQQWSNNIHNKLFQIQPTLGEWRSASTKSRREQVVISRLRIGHYKAYSLFHFETGTTTTMFNLPDNLHGYTHSYRMQNFRYYQKAIFQSK